MKNFKKELLDKVINNIKKGLIDNNFIYEDNFLNIKYKKLEIENSKDVINFFVYTYQDNIKTNKLCMDNGICFLYDFEKFYHDGQFFRTVIDYLYDIEESKQNILKNKEILNNTFKQTSKTKTNRI